ncbi:MAG: extracellular solute-binding protein, partial [Candidatus Tectomicrobia bacterium]|nr:extracellular solute-binding protein [Candidatus Tectomicrobia bacterium]
PKWKGKVAMASTQERSVLLWLASIVALKGDNFARDYFKGLAANVKVLSGHTEVRQAVGRGEFQIGLVNHYYYLQEKKEGSPVGIYYPDQGPDDIGVLVFPSAIAIVKGTKHPKAAQAFTDFMLSEKMRSELAQEIGEIPLTVAAQPAGLEELRPLEQLRQTPVTIPQLTDLFEKTLKLVEPYGF